MSINAAMNPYSALDLTSAAVRMKFGAIDITTFVRRKKKRRVGNFFGFANAPKRSGCGFHVHHLLMEFLGRS